MFQYVHRHSCSIVCVYGGNCQLTYGVRWAAIADCIAVHLILITETSQLLSPVCVCVCVYELVGASCVWRSSSRMCTETHRVHYGRQQKVCQSRASTCDPWTYEGFLEIRTGYPIAITITITITVAIRVSNPRSSSPTPLPPCSERFAISITTTITISGTAFQVLEWCSEVGVEEVTVFAFSLQNFRRTAGEIHGLFDLAKDKINEIFESE